MIYGLNTPEIYLLRHTILVKVEFGLIALVFIMYPP